MNLVPFALGELFGPLRCEHQGCQKNCWIVWMTQEQYDYARSQESPGFHVMDKAIGTALCDVHKPVEKQE